MKKAKHGTHGHNVSFPFAVFRGTLLSLALCAAFLVFAALILLKAKNPAPLVTPVALGALLLSSFLGGARTGRLHGHSGALCGIAMGTLLSFLCLVAALILEGGSLSLAVVPQYAALVLLGTLGGVTSTRTKKRRRH